MKFGAVSKFIRADPSGMDWAYPPSSKSLAARALASEALL
jgi:hypothetical protein